MLRLSLFQASVAFNVTFSDAKVWRFIRSKNLGRKMSKLLLVFLILPCLVGAGTNYLDIAGQLRCDGVPYRGATVLAVDKGVQTYSSFMFLVLLSN